MEYNKNKARGYTLPHDTPLNHHMKRVKEITSSVSRPLLILLHPTHPDLII